MDKLLNVTKALADGSRLRILAALDGRELCVCQLTELLKLAPSTVSRHISILRQAGLVFSRKEGRWVNYQLVGQDAPVEVRGALSWISRVMEADQNAVGDQVRLEEILSIDRDYLCSRQAKR